MDEGVFPLSRCKDDNKDNKCDWCNKSLGGEEPEQPTPDKPSTPEEPNPDCNCGCHAGGLRTLFFRFILFFQKFFGMNKTCDCGQAHY